MFWFHILPPFNVTPKSTKDFRKMPDFHQRIIIKQGSLTSPTRCVGRMLRNSNFLIRPCAHTMEGSCTTHPPLLFYIIRPYGFNHKINCLIRSARSCCCCLCAISNRLLDHRHIFVFRSCRNCLFLLNHCLPVLA